MSRRSSSCAHQSARSARRCAGPLGALTAPISSMTTSGVAHDRHVGAAVLADLGRVDVGVHDLWRAGRSESSWPVTRSSNRAPERDEQVGLLQRVHGRTVPCMPGMPTCCGCESGNAPRAISVVTTGTPVSSASCSSSGGRLRLEHAAADVQHGRFAAVISRAASRICLPCGGSSAGSRAARASAASGTWSAPAARPWGCPPAPGRVGRVDARWNASAIDPRHLLGRHAPGSCAS